MTQDKSQVDRSAHIVSAPKAKAISASQLWNNAILRGQVNFPASLGTRHEWTEVKGAVKAELSMTLATNGNNFGEVTFSRVDTKPHLYGQGKQSREFLKWFFEWTFLAEGDAIVAKIQTLSEVF